MKAKDLLVISSLALPYNPLFGAPPSQAEVAIFRLPGRVFFISDLEKQREGFAILDCMKEKGLLSKYLQKDLTELKKKSIRALFAGPTSEQELLRAVTPYMYLEKLKLTAVVRGKSRVSHNELAMLGRKCAQYHWDTLSRYEKSLFISEVYLRERFLKSAGAKHESAQQINALLEYRSSLDVKDRHEFLRLRPRKELQ